MYFIMIQAVLVGGMMPSRINSKSSIVTSEIGASFAIVAALLQAVSPTPRSCFVADSSETSILLDGMDWAIYLQRCRKLWRLDGIADDIV